MQSGISKLLALFPDKSFSEVEINEYNNTLSAEYELIRDFIVLHYKMTERNDSPFWIRCRDMEITDTLQQKIDLFRSRGRVMRWTPDLFADDSWIAVLMGQGVIPQGYDPVADALPFANTRDYLLHMRDAVSKTAYAIYQPTKNL